MLADDTLERDLKRENARLRSENRSLRAALRLTEKALDDAKLALKERSGLVDLGEEW